MNTLPKQKKISGIKHIIAVGSGKGGVGKSTVALNLALALKKKDLKIGLMDADIYGPSIPLITGTKKNKMLIENDYLLPVHQFGIKISSIGYLVDEDSALIWRGPMLFKAIEQFLNDVLWGDLHYLIVELPPGTGDVALTLAQKTPVSGGIVVTTPQNLALSEMIKAINMFKEIQIPLLGAIENMSYFKPSNNLESIQLFPKGNLDTYLKEHDIKKLIKIPFHPDIGICSESGIPIVESNPHSIEGKSFIDLAHKIHQNF